MMDEQLIFTPWTVFITLLVFLFKYLSCTLLFKLLVYDLIFLKFGKDFISQFATDFQAS